jgi:hypothetical protein
MGPLPSAFCISSAFTKNRMTALFRLGSILSSTVNVRARASVRTSLSSADSRRFFWQARPWLLQPGLRGYTSAARYQRRRPSLRGCGGLRPLSERQMWPLVGFDGQPWWALMVSPCIARIAQACYKGIRPAMISDSDLGSLVGFDG